MFFSRRPRTESKRAEQRRRLAHRRSLRIENLEERRVLSTVPTGLPIASWIETPLNDVPVATSTDHKPQSKAWQHDDSWWAVLAEDSGTWLYKLEGTSWRQELRITTESGIHADVKADGDLAHVLLFDGPESQVATLEYFSNLGTYQPWSVRSELVDIALDLDVEVATLDIDSTGRLWVASDAENTVEVRHADVAASSFSAPITVGTDISSDDISVVTALPNGTVGVFWSNQNSEQFGFRVHVDGTDPTAWLAEEVPADDSTGGGVADDHVNVAVTSDGTLYAAIKTSYDTNGEPSIGLLIRRPNGQWDPLYEVDNRGTRPIVVVNELENRLIVVYTETTGGDAIVMRESLLDTIAFSAKQTIFSGNLNNVTSTKDDFTDELIIFAMQGGDAVSTLLNVDTQDPPPTDIVTAVFQDGVDGYQGTRDTFILVDNANTAFGGESTLEFDGSPESSALIQWDVSSVPTGSQATDAKITLNVTNRSGHDYQLYELLRNWTESGATWNQAAGGSSWQANGAQGSQDRGTTSLGTVAAESTGTLTLSLNAAGLAAVQGWIDDPASNHGIIIQNYTSATNGVDVNSRETNTTSSRPRLDVTYLTDGNTEPPTEENQPPVVSAGSDQTIQLSESASLSGSASDDGLPDPPAAVSVQWTVDSGPGNVTFTSPQTAATSASFSQTGTYVLRLTASDSDLGASDTMTVTVLDDTPTETNQPPVVSAGPNRTIQISESASLSGSASDDGLPDPPAAMSVQWTVDSGPGSVNFTAPQSETTSATFSQDGVYVLRLTASDGERSASDAMTVTVLVDPPPTDIVTAVFQDGVDGYQGTRDTFILVDNANTAFGGESTLEFDGSPESSALIQWDVSSVPTGSQATDAKITLNVTNRSGHDYQLYELLRNWTESGATWNQAAGGSSWQANGAQGSQDRGTTSLGTVAAESTGTLTLSLNAAGLAAVQGWIDDPASNHGIIIQNYTSATNGVDVNSRETNTTSSRPRLDVTYLTDGNTEPPTEENQPPVVSAGSDQTIQLSESASLSGSASDDGLPDPPAAVSVQWTVDSGPDNVTFTSPQTAATSASFSQTGTYVLRLTASDSDLGASDTMTVTVLDDTPTETNQPPVVSAGPNRTIQLSESASLSGSASDDGLPDPPAAMSVQWTVDSGPGSVNFTAPQSETTSATFSQDGVYVLRLTASDGERSASDTTQIVVDSDTPPTVTAGLIGYWRLDTMGPFLPDDSSSGNDATAVGNPQTITGPVDAALALDGNDYAVVANDPSLDAPSAITLSTWIRPDRSGTQYVLKKAEKDTTDGYELSLSSKGTVFVRFDEASSGNTYRLDSLSDYPTDGNVWMHVAATYDGSTIRLYINGVLESSKSANFQIASNSLDLHIGSGNDGFRPLTGAIDEVHVYDRALTTAEVQQLAAL